ncbi:MAG: hypothetical protein J3K34DRAFT_40797 [Monoraphidium minutum]|nr:MAG: hypothetical protein J3K34DRAFT_40797 [Monoraphidium minutum]
MRCAARALLAGPAAECSRLPSGSAHMAACSPVHLVALVAWVRGHVEVARCGSLPFAASARVSRPATSINQLTTGLANVFARGQPPSGNAPSDLWPDRWQDARVIDISTRTDGMFPSSTPIYLWGPYIRGWRSCCALLICCACCSSALRTAQRTFASLDPWSPDCMPMAVAGACVPVWLDQCVCVSLSLCVCGEAIVWHRAGGARIGAACSSPRPRPHPPAPAPAPTPGGASLTSGSQALPPLSTHHPARRESAAAQPCAAARVRRRRRGRRWRVWRTAAAALAVGRVAAVVVGPDYATAAGLLISAAATAPVAGALGLARLPLWLPPLPSPPPAAWRRHVDAGRARWRR